MEKNISKKKLLSIDDKQIFDRFLSLTPRRLSPYHFANILIWEDIFQIFWHKIENCLCVFFYNSGGCFMYLPPLGKVNDKVIKACFGVMDDYNHNKRISRIENVEVPMLDLFPPKEFLVREKPGDYVYNCADLIGLKGDKFKSKRSVYNYFIKRFSYKPMDYRDEYKDACLVLCKRWVEAGKTNKKDDFYCYMLGDTLRAQTTALEYFFQIGLRGLLVIIDGTVAGYTLGYELNNDMFCIAFEVCERKYKGIYQFIFREFCRALTGYRYINCMDDSGLPNLQITKTSYYPVEMILNYVVERHKHQSI
ncbi:MAG: DUF2156 domain-containing protein [Candidatus Omnitrophica bacterium]|nr:DUF2156 domain-containing protein [Candidatus Omnitrophota bacterium]MBU4478998.1 DUF2156 domain-containing protein [Candidatus Omnitrophota bacterium]MCG2703793.1 phosphatidylglycerol lysyltransferase domain-containing protein [Candidatus Omnitrophota bacterium]MCG2711292.1 phosphatidylglycerol lysyltransferase domain-containing protein [Candidatus Omnitrophota bacterium]